VNRPVAAVTGVAFFDYGQTGVAPNAISSCTRCSVSDA
jgi:hypothetical protein